jgi:protein Mpv17
MGVWGVALAGPAMHFWYGGLDKLIKFQGIKGTLCKLVLDQSFFAPAIIASFFSYSALAEGRGVDGAMSRLEHLYLPALQMNYLIWPAANFINFRVCKASGPEAAAAAAA